jgi:hypothetical protein
MEEKGDPWGKEVIYRERALLASSLRYDVKTEALIMFYC